jgi:GT2 family glycosyltransferase
MMESFIKNTTSPYHLIIIDNGSIDGTPEYLNNKISHLHLNNPHCLGVELLFNEKNKGIAAGRNQGLFIAQKLGDNYLSTIDNDVEFPAKWLDDCLDVMQSNPRFAIGINFEGTEYPLQVHNGKTIQFKAVGNLGTACTVFPRHLFASIGYFNTEMGPYAHEDADYFFRARMVGYQIGYLKENGIHFGEGELDMGEYREFKTKCSKDNLAKFQANCYAYMSRRKSYYLPYSE